MSTQKVAYYEDETGAIRPSSIDVSALSSLGTAVDVTNGGAGNAGKLFKLDSAGKAAGRVLENELPILKAKLDITNAQLKTLNATPRSIIAAPGSGKYIEVVSAHFWFKYTAPAFDGVSENEDLTLRYTNASGDVLIDPVAGVGFGDATADVHSLRKGVDVDPVDNAAVVVHLMGGEWFAAAGAGSLSVEVSYIVRDFTF